MLIIKNPLSRLFETNREGFSFAEKLPTLCPNITQWNIFLELKQVKETLF
jgi:hypothetical protein